MSHTDSFDSCECGTVADFAPTCI